jgi:hypothetical protein
MRPNEKQIVVALAVKSAVVSARRVAEEIVPVDLSRDRRDFFFIEP